MYTVPLHDQVHELDDVPLPDPEAPDPRLLAGESSLVVAYRSARSSTETPATLVLFRDCFAVHFGLPNDHAFASHQLAGQNLPPCGAFEVVTSSWIRQLELRNQSHPRHDPLLFQQLRHWVWTFRDSVLECAALSWSTEDSGPLGDQLARMHELLR